MKLRLVSALPMKLNALESYPHALPPGKKRDALLQKARLADLGARVNGWLAGPEPATGHPLRRARPELSKLAARGLMMVGECRPL